MELLFTSDLHGSSSHYQAVLDELRRQPSDILILGGDMHPDGDRGMPYNLVMHYLHHNLQPFLQSVIDLNAGIRTLAILGNHDWSFTTPVYESFQQEHLLTLLRPDQPFKTAEFTFVGLSHCPPAPYWIKDFERRDLPDDPPSEFGGYIWSSQLQAITPVKGEEYFITHPSLHQMLDDIPSLDQPFILVSHAPPFNTNLDLLPDGRHVGSEAVRRFITQRQPILSLHGHFHESPLVSGHFTDRLNATLCANPGQDTDKPCFVRWHSDNPQQLQHSLGWIP